jgi:hypothetical protein
MKHKMTPKEASELVKSLKPQKNNAELLAVVMAATSHMIEYPPHWMINFMCGRLDRIFSELADKPKH